LAVNDNYILNAFLDAPRTILGKIFLFLSAVFAGQIMACIASGGFIAGPLDFCFFVLINFGWGMLSGVGLIFVVIDFWYIYRLTYQEESAHTFFFVIAASQLGLATSAALIDDMLSQVWFGMTLGLVFMGLLYWGTKKLNLWIMEKRTGISTAAK